MLESGEYHSSVSGKLQEALTGKKPEEFVVIALRE